MDANPDVERWVVGGHSLGGVMAVVGGRPRRRPHPGPAAVGLVPEQRASPTAPSWRSRRSSAPRTGSPRPPTSTRTKDRLPPDTTFVEVVGGNHAFFGDYGEQGGDGVATITREEAQDQIRAASLELVRAGGRRRPEPADGSRPGDGRQGANIVDAAAPATIGASHGRQRADRRALLPGRTSTSHGVLDGLATEDLLDGARARARTRSGGCCGTSPGCRTCTSPRSSSRTRCGWSPAGRAASGSTPTRRTWATATPPSRSWPCGPRAPRRSATYHAEVEERTRTLVAALTADVARPDRRPPVGPARDPRACGWCRSPTTTSSTPARPPT